MKSIGWYAAVACIAPALAWCQSYPAKPIRTIMTVLGASEASGRIVAQKMTESMGQPVIFETMSAAGGAVAAHTVARAAADGYTLLYATSSPMVLRPFLTRNTPYDTVRDFTPVTQVSEAVACVAASASLPVNSIKQLIEYARQHPGKISFGSSGIGTTHHLSGEMIKQIAGIDMVHVPYKSGAQSFTDLATGRVDLVFGVYASAAPHVKAGKAKLLAINAGKRYAAAGDIPTLGEQLPGYERPPGWMGYMGPAGLPQPIVRRLFAEIGKAMQNPEVIGVFEKLGLLVEVSGSPEEFAAVVRQSIAQAGKIIRSAGIEPE